MHDHDDVHDDLAERLRANRPELSALELDAVRRRVRTRVAGSPARKRTRSELMKSRLAILGMLVAGLLFSGTGGAMAISGFAGSQGNAAKVQYDHGDHNNGTVGPDVTNGNSGGGNNGGGNNHQVTGSSTPNTLQPTRQVEAGAGGSSLPFTGFAAIPVLLGGIALLSAGLVLRRRARES